MTVNASYGYTPAYLYFKHTVRVVHFAGGQKPWRGIPHPQPGLHAQCLVFALMLRPGNEGLIELHELWWKEHDDLLASLSYSASYKTLMVSARISIQCKRSLTHPGIAPSQEPGACDAAAADRQAPPRVICHAARCPPPA